MSDEGLTHRIQDFLSRFETVFHGDWDHTKGCLEEIKGSFLDPTPGEFFDGDSLGNYSWSNYSGLLDAYRELKAYMISEGLYITDETDNP
jgi:hypothetical protein